MGCRDELRPACTGPCPVPDGLEGQRVDQALSRLFGLSRTAAAEVADAGGVVVDGRARGKGDRLTGRQLARGRAAAAAGRAGAPPRPVEGMTILYDDDDLVVVDKPVGVAAHPSPGWDGPTVIGGLAAAGLPDLHLRRGRAAGRRPPAGRRDDRRDGGRQERARLHRAEGGVQGAHGRRRATTRSCRATPIRRAAPSTPRSTGTRKHDWRFAVVSGGRPSVTHYQVIEAFPAASLVDIQLETGRTHQIRVHFSALRHPCVGDTTYGADPTLAARLGVERQWLHAVRLGFPHPADGRFVEFTSEYPPDLAGALAVLRAET